MDSDAILILLALGPASAVGFYWAMHRHYRNTDKSHAFERETKIDAKPVTGIEQDRKVDRITGTQATRIAGDNVADYRARVERLGSG